jgi:O-antigen/teichoic acid export membrane protein
MGKIRRLAGDTVLYGLGSIVPRFLNFLLVALHTRVLTKAEYGIITDILALMAFLNVVYAFGMETTYFRFASKPGADEKKIFNQAQTAVTVISFGLSILLAVAAIPMAKEFGVGAHPEYFYWVIGIMLIDALVVIPFAQLRFQKKALTFAAGRLINVLIQIALNLYFLKVIYDPTVNFAYVILANLLSNAFFLLFFARAFARWRPVFDGTMIREMFRYAYPVMLTGLAGMTNEMFSRKTLRYWLPDNFYPGRTRDEVLGIFAAAYKYSVIMNLTIQAFRYAAEPFFFSNASDKNSPELFARVNHYFTVFCCIILLGVSINLDLLSIYVGKDFREGMHIVPILLLAYLFLGIYYNISAWFKLTDQTYYGTYITTAGAIITIAGNYFLIPHLGYTGSSIAALICYFVMAIVCYVLGQKFYPVPYRVGKDMTYIMGTTLLVYIINSIDITNLWLASSFHAAVIAVYLLAIYLLEKNELKGSRQ